MNLSHMNNRVSLYALHNSNLNNIQIPSTEFICKSVKVIVEYMAYNYQLNCLWVVVNLSLIRLIKIKKPILDPPNAKGLTQKVNQQIDFLYVYGNEAHYTDHPLENSLLFEIIVNYGNVKLIFLFFLFSLQILWDWKL